MNKPEKYITVVPLTHPGTPDGTMEQINPEYVEYLEKEITRAMDFLLIPSGGGAYDILKEAIGEAIVSDHTFDKAF